MRHQAINPNGFEDPSGTVIVADGYGIKIRVDRRHLVIDDGYGSNRRHRRFPRATTNLKRLVLVGHTGYVTLEALRWLDGIGAAWIHLTRNGRLIATSSNVGLNNARLRRAQAASMTNPVGLQIAKKILRWKLAGQHKVAADLPGDNVRFAIAAEMRSLDQAQTLDECVVAEAVAARAYWDSWRTITIQYPTRDRDQVPDQWRTFGTRSSPITNSPRRAANPANAILNYLYSLVEAETRIALLAVGLDPGLGIVHADLQARDSLVFDVMESVRPDADRYLLDLLQGHTLRSNDFTETHRGVCRVLPPLTHVLAATTRTWAEAVAPIAEHTARTLGDTDTRISRVPTPLTGANRKTATAHITRKNPRRSARPATPDPACTTCGEPTTTKAMFCDPCRDEHHRARLIDLQDQAVATLKQARERGEDPAHGGTAGQKRSDSMTKRNRQNKEWEEQNERPKPEVFQRTILPLIQDVSINELVRATGLSRPYCSMIRRGAYTPHPRHWDALKAIGDAAHD